jgi:hypothetical protein
MRYNIHFRRLERIKEIREFLTGKRKTEMEKSTNMRQKKCILGEL